MAETFYGVLGVDRDAGTEAVERAYRERVKESHPDVSDDPSAPAEFSRLTAARDVLVDDDERARYDRLGHATYVRDHVETSAWSVESETDEPVGDDPDPDPGPDDATGTDRRATGGSTSGDGHERRTQDYASERRAGTKRRRNRNRTSTGTRDGAARARSDGGTAVGEGPTWASRRAADAPTDRRPLWRRVAAGVGALGPWALVHLVFVGSALATAWFVYGGVSSLDMPLPAAAVAVVVVGSALLASTVDVMARLCR